MTTWYSKDIGDGGHAFGPSIKIQQAFLALYVAAGKSEGVAVFSRYKSATDKVTVFFTPEASALAEKFDAVPCDKPAGDEIAFLLGDRHSVGRYFPEMGSKPVVSRQIAQRGGRPGNLAAAF